MSQSTSPSRASASRLLSLPAELRESIYSLAFSTTAHEGGSNLTELQPPDKSLLLTCRQIHAEARQIYRTAHRHYWTGTDFVLNLFNIPRTREEGWQTAIIKYREDISHVECLRVQIFNQPGFTLVDNRGGWKAHVGGREQHFRARLWLHGGKVDLTRLAYDTHADKASLREACALYPCGHSLSQQILLLPSLMDIFCDD